MDEKRMLEEIKESAENVKIPASLYPEEIEKHIEKQIEKRTDKKNDNKKNDRRKDKRKRDKIAAAQRYGVWAAAALLFAGFLFMAQFGIREQKTDKKKENPLIEETLLMDSENAATHTDETEKYVEESAESAERAEAENISNDDSFLSVESYEELYQILTHYEGESVSVSSEASLENAGQPEKGMMSTKSSQVTLHTAGDTDRSEEADFVKTDGEYIYVMDESGSVRIVDAESLDSISEIPGVADFAGQRLEAMYVDGDKLQIIQSYEEYREEISCPAERPEEDGKIKMPVQTWQSIRTDKTVVKTYDISDKTAPKRAGVYSQDGFYLASKKEGDILYLFTGYYPQIVPDSDRIEYYIPQTGDCYLPCDVIYLPHKEIMAEIQGAGYLVAASIEVSAPTHTKDSLSVVGCGDMVYVGENSIYAAGTSGFDGEETQTDIVRLGYREGIFTTDARGTIPGMVNSSFFMEEYEEMLRVVSSQNLYILDRELQVIGKLENPTGGNTVQSARFLGDTGYLTVAENGEPVVMIDLKDPANPEKTGELEAAGFQDSLHFLGEDRLLGISLEFDSDTNEVQGLKCAVLDISSPDNPKEFTCLLENAAFCGALENDKALLVNEEKKVFGFLYWVDRNEHHPSDICMGHGENGTFDCYGLFSYEEGKGIAPLHSFMIDKGDIFTDAQNLRGLYIGDIFYLVSSKGIRSYDSSEEFTPVNTFLW